MAKTERLYYDNSFLYGFDGTVVEATPDQNGRVRVVLDRTAMYPTSGGQPFDTGELAWDGRAFRVIEVADREPDDTIVHLVEGGEGLAAGMRVTCRIDEERRRDHMQQHSGQHVLSAAFVRLFGLPTVSFHLGEEVCTIDLETNSLAPKQVEQAERLANRIVTEDRPVVIRYASPEEARQMGVRKLPPRTGTIRLIDISDFDLTACGGTHVRTTGQIGAILLRKVEKVKQGIRVEFVCGDRAIRASRREYLALTAAAEVLSTAPADLAPQIARLAELIKSTQKREVQLLEQLAHFEARDLVQKSSAGIVEAQYEARDANYAKLVAKSIVAHGARAALISSTNPAPVIVLSAKPGNGINAGAILKQALAEIGARGGGTVELAQGGVGDQQKLRQVLQSIRSQLGLPS
jgi:alanyl-tRNA synthetase